MLKNEIPKADEGAILCRYCHRELDALSPYSEEKGIPMCSFCEVKHKEFEAIKLKRQQSQPPDNNAL